MRFALRPALAAAIVAALAVGVATSSAASAPVVLTDQAGDANAVNDQGQGVAPGSPGPGSQAAYDILSVTLAPLTKGTGKKAECLGYTATMELSAPASTSNTLYRVLGKGSVNTSLFWLQFQNNPIGGTTTTVRYSSGTSMTTGLKNAAKLEGNKVVWTVLLSDLKGTGEKGVGTQITNLGADVRSSTGVVTAPLWDQIPAGDKSFTVCG